MAYISFKDERLGMPTIGRAVIATLYVSPNGDNSNGSSWTKAYTTIQGALAVASTDVNECTLILIGINTGANYYDIDTTGDPTYTGNYILKGTHRTWQKIKNDHETATSVMKFTGYVSLNDLNFNLGTGNNGVIITKGAFRVRNVQFVGEDLTGTATALHIDGATTLKHGILENVIFRGETTYMTGLLIDNTCCSLFERLQFHDCLTAIQIVNAGSYENLFNFIDIGGCNATVAVEGTDGIGLDIDVGDNQHFENVLFHDNTINIDDEVGNHIWIDMKGSFSMDTEPQNLTGVTVTAGAAADAWGADVEVRAAATSTTPFRIVGYSFEPAVTQKHKMRFTADDGTTYFDEVFFEQTKNSTGAAPAGTEYIFNTGTQIKASCKAETDGSDTVQVWLKIQEI